MKGKALLPGRDGMNGSCPGPPISQNPRSLQQKAEMLPAFPGTTETRRTMVLASVGGACPLDQVCKGFSLKNSYSELKTKSSKARTVKVKSLSRVRLLATPWTVADQAPLPTGFSREEYWSGVPFPKQKMEGRQGRGSHSCPGAGGGGSGLPTPAPVWGRVMAPRLVPTPRRRVVLSQSQGAGPAPSVPSSPPGRRSSASGPCSRTSTG